MTIREFISAVEKLYLLEYDLSLYIVERLKKQQAELIRLLDRLDDEGYAYLRENRDVVKARINYLYSSVENSIEHFFDGYYSESRNIIYETFFDKTNSLRVPLRIKTVVSGSLFYRMRDSSSYDLYPAKEMFHIPFEKRELTANQRFSISGYPCLYLGSSIYNCWEELHRPNIDLCNIALLKNVKPIRVINLAVTPLDLRTIGANKIYNIVLSLVCSLKVNNHNAPFKPEYIIPQNVLSSLIVRNTRPNYQYFDGIKYTSTFYGSKRCIFHDKSLFDNYVIPIKRSKKEGLCKELCGMFKISPPTTLTINKLTRNSRGWMSIAPNDAGTYSPYRISEFGVLEDKLKEAELSLVSDIL